MAIAGVVRRAEPPQVDRNHAGGVGAVNQGFYPLRTQPLDQFRDGKDHGRRAADMIQDGNPRPGTHARDHSIDNLIRRFHGRGNVGNDYRRESPLGNESRHIVAGVVAVRRHQDFLARAESQRSQDAICARGGIGDKDQVLRIGADQFREALPRAVEQSRHLPHKELHGLSGQLAAQLLLPLEHHASHGAK